MARTKTSFLLLLCFALVTGRAQTGHPLAQLEKALTEERYQEADSLLQARMQFFLSRRQLDSIPAYLSYLGRVEEKQHSPEAAFRKLERFIGQFKALGPNAGQLSRVYTQAGAYYGSTGRNQQAYTANREAYRLARQAPGTEPETLASIDSNLGTYAYRMGHVHLAADHHRKAIRVFSARKKKTHTESLYVSANNMGSVMWHASKMDSALYYYNIALDALAQMEPTPLNRYYRPAVLQNNLCALYNLRGETARAIEAMKTCIENLRVYLATPEPGPKKPTAVSFQYEATDNLAGIYKELGDYTRAHELLWYSYRQKQRNTGEDPTGVYKSQILLGQLYYARREHRKAVEFLTAGWNKIAGVDGDYLFWQADACNTLALVHEELGTPEKAAFFYEKADSLYEASLGGIYDDIYLGFLNNASTFYAKNNRLDLALSKANKSFRYVKAAQGSETLLAFYQLLNLSEVYLTAGRYRQALDYSSRGLSVVEKRMRHSSSLMDSVKTELKKPKALLLHARARYHLPGNKDVPGLKAILNELNEALTILERRKSILPDVKDAGLLLADHMDLLDFIKLVNLDLYRLTGDRSYIGRVLSLQESGVYTRIRARLDKSDSILFARVPRSLQQQEQQLKTVLRTALEGDAGHHRSMGNYLAALDRWNRFQASLKKQYPDYFRTRYGSIVKSMEEVHRSLPARTTVIRYFFTGRDLYAVVLDQEQQSLYRLQAPQLEKSISALSSFATPNAEYAALLYQLYGQLWAPLAKAVRHSKVVIIPDGILYHLNFELLTPQRISRFDELSSRSLLARYTVAYHYSLALVGQQKKARPEKNFVAFAPGFSDAGKQRYRARVRDSFLLDEGYVSLLPQPFTLDFVKKAQARLGGSVFTNEASTAASFKAHAGNHKIIHIGTHGEANNLSPEYSRLIFAKDGKHPEQNSVYLPELYNCNLTAELAVLTACESGKPGYQDGEGMISLAHAFNYAGSESILTGLWKIDEQASTLLLEAFYQNLQEGMDKDEALRKAKLHYLEHAQGRVLAPPYWAGLVLMGDTSPVSLEKEPFSAWWWMAGTAVILALLCGYLYKRKGRTAAGRPAP
ncbi:MAG TPA: CHAT domain-containing protein [Chitinophagaceae bacterium]|nr:CHAT domain-containing protein [Chitinophagaceae bacterium]